eukprot:15187541-Alexandrium_andersonii.AAC.1
MSERGISRGSAGIHQGRSGNSKGAEWGHQRYTGLRGGSIGFKGECVGTQQGFNRDRARTIKSILHFTDCLLYTSPSPRD